MRTKMTDYESNKVLVGGFIVYAIAIVIAFVVLAVYPASARSHTPHVLPEATVAKIAPFALSGPGPYLVINANKQVVATVIAGQVVPLDVQFAPARTIPTVRYQIEQIGPSGARDEPETCPRGMKVLRYGFWGC